MTKNFTSRDFVDYMYVYMDDIQCNCTIIARVQ